MIPAGGATILGALLQVTRSPDGGAPPYAGMGNANPDAATQIGNGFSTTSLKYDGTAIFSNLAMEPQLQHICMIMQTASSRSAPGV